jgi:ligand-binding sensor domain-containing protein
MKLPGMPIDTANRALTEDRRGQVWIGTWFQGLYRYNGKAFRHYLLGIESPGNAVSSILADKSRGLWVRTYTGIFRRARTYPPFLLSRIKPHYMSSRRSRRIRAGGTSTGLYRVRDGRVLTVSGLLNPHILSLTLDSKGYVWAGTKAGGVASVHLQRAMPMPSNGGLAPLLVNSAIEDDDGHLWFSTSRGIVRLVVAEMHAVADGKRSLLSPVVLGKADGMRSSEGGGGPSTPASTRILDSTVWFTTARGFVHTTDVAEKLAPNSPTASITGWTLSNDPNVSDITTGPRVDVEAGQPDIIFFFNAGLLSNPAHIEYRYRLAGYDSDWTNTRSHTVRYRRLAPGSYRFEMQARNSG